ncbi:hypothetical protein C8241_19815 [Paracidovorax avenae]|nr:hypothetical protein C8241_19815 [Paracidovorax avenae]AVS65645.1 hypothetical protein C8245_08050 [Paracidovorax avenae]AVT14213.1 hypothetical protein C8235_15815 [Paracidovorax avenae]
MRELTVKDGNEDIREEDVRAACDAIVRSESFAKAHRMQRLLRFLVTQAIAGDSRNTSEYAIGIEVFGRDPASFLPSEDPIVRVQVGRLRQRLDAYYAGNDPPHGIEIHIPVGTYMPVVRRRGAALRDAGFAHLLMLQPLHCIAERVDGQAFAYGLHEELLEQLYKSFGDVLMASGPPPAPAAAAGPVPRCAQRLVARHSIEGSVRIDAERIRASIRLVDSSLRRITWARNFDRSVQLGIEQQEELAACICSALRQIFRR